MGLSIGRQRVLDVYYGSQRVKAAYIGRVKVWSIPELPWIIGQSYDQGDLVKIGRNVFRSRIRHTASEFNKPGKSHTHWVIN
uniref:Uncharacterized protein n=1 Tax=Siphoviridae sp. ctGkF2 TaxID=2827823 RepID=A0A8S5TLI8_9CAUD|nr:MAG TPA: hypothetical protein [Siphoviridae sp. ctGkF2]